MKTNPNAFSRSRSMMAVIAEAITAGFPMQTFLSEMTPYKSRGKGGKYKANCAKPQYIPNAGKYTPHQGAQECVRRMAHAARAQDKETVAFLRAEYNFN